MALTEYFRSLTEIAERRDNFFAPECFARDAAECFRSLTELPESRNKMVDAVDLPALVKLFSFPVDLCPERAMTFVYINVGSKFTHRSMRGQTLVYACPCRAA